MYFFTEVPCFDPVFTRLRISDYYNYFLSSFSSSSSSRSTRFSLRQPITHWTPSISPSGMAFYTSNRLPVWKNNLFLAALGTRHLRRLEIKNGKVISEEKLFSSLNERVRHVRTDPDGWPYFSTDSGKLIRVQR